MQIDAGDGISFVFDRIESIRDDDDYNNFRVYITAYFGKIENPMKIDITTGDIITPSAVNYSYKTIFDADKIDVMAYNTETIIAEKFETIIRRNIGSTRARDFYDLYMFYNLYKDSLNIGILKLAITKTAEKRNSRKIMAESSEIICEMINDPALKNLWDNYRNNNSYAAEISYNSIMETVSNLSELVPV